MLKIETYGRAPMGTTQETTVVTVVCHKEQCTPGCYRGFIQWEWGGGGKAPTPPPKRRKGERERERRGARALDNGRGHAPSTPNRNIWMKPWLVFQKLLLPSYTPFKIIPVYVLMVPVRHIVILIGARNVYNEHQLPSLCLPVPLYSKPVWWHDTRIASP